MYVILALFTRTTAAGRASGHTTPNFKTRRQAVFQRIAGFHAVAGPCGLGLTGIIGTLRATHREPWTNKGAWDWITQTPAGTASRLRPEHVIQERAARGSFGDSRRTGTCARGIYAVAAWTKPHTHRTGAFDFHRFTFQLYGGQKLNRFRLDNIPKRPPQPRRTRNTLFVRAGCSLDAATQAGALHAIQLLLHRGVVRMAWETLHGNGVEGDGIGSTLARRQSGPITSRFSFTKNTAHRALATKS